MRTLRTTLSILALLAGSAGGASAATIEVPCSELGLFLLLGVANGNGEQDTLLLAPGCAYVLPETLVVEPDGGAPLTIQGRGATFSGNVQVTPIRVEAGATLNLHAVTVRDGVSSDLGGGIHNAGTLHVTGSTIAANDAANGGGGIFTDEATTLTVTNTTFVGNFANAGGALLAYPVAQVTVVNSTLYANLANPHGAGLFSASAYVEVRNSIIANSVHGTDCIILGIDVAWTGGNLGSDGTCGPQLLSGDPKLGIPTGNPAYYPLLAGSPAIDAGSNDGCPAADQRNVQRPLDGDADGVTRCDLGAFEKPQNVACGLFGFEALALLPWLRRRASAASASAAVAAEAPAVGAGTS